MLAQSVARATLLALLALLVLLPSASGDTCDFGYAHVNTGAGRRKEKLSLVCLDDQRNCTFGLAHRAGLGCANAEVIQREVPSNGGVAVVSADVHQGAFVCSTGVSAVYAAENNRRARESWHSASERGKKFGFPTDRTNVVCFLSAFENGAEVFETREGTANLAVSLGPFGSAELQPDGKKGDVVMLSSNEDFVVSCSLRGAPKKEFSNLLPLTTAPVFTWASTNLLVSQVDCTSLDVAIDDAPSCAQSDGASCVGIKDKPRDEYTRFVRAIAAYAGPAAVLSPFNAGMCVVARTLGIDATSPLDSSQFKTLFAFPGEATGVAVLSDATATCVLRMPNTGAELATLVTASSGGEAVSDAHFAGAIPTGSVMTCDVPVMAVATTRSREINLKGGSSMVGVIDTEIPGLNRTSQTCTSSPSREKPEEEEELPLPVILGGSSAAALLVGLGAAVILVRRSRRRHDVQSTMAYVPGSMERNRGGTLYKPSVGLFVQPVHLGRWSGASSQGKRDNDSGVLGSEFETATDDSNEARIDPEDFL